jgi:hypothetical protein
VSQLLDSGIQMSEAGLLRKIELVPHQGKNSEPCDVSDRDGGEKNLYRLRYSVGVSELWNFSAYCSCSTRRIISEISSVVQMFWIFADNKSSTIPDAEMQRVVPFAVARRMAQGGVGSPSVKVVRLVGSEHTIHRSNEGEMVDLIWSWLYCDTLKGHS